MDKATQEIAKRKKDLWWVLTTCLCSVLAFLITVGLGIYLKRQHDFAPLNRVLKKKVDDPKVLLQILSWDKTQINGKPYGLPTWDVYELQHLALVRLLELQKAKFGSVVAAPAHECTGHDSPVVDISGYTRSGHLVVAGTPSLYADNHEQDGPYWRIELFEFTTEGRLVHRQCYTKEAQDKLLHALSN